MGEASPHHGFKESDLGPLPAEWEVGVLRELAEKPQYGLTASAVENPVGPQFLRITDIQNGAVNWPSVPYCKCLDADLEKCRLRSGDLVVARIGATTGKTYLITDPPEAVFASYLIRIRTKAPLVPEFFSQFTNSSLYWQQINEAKGGRLKQGVNIPNLESLKVPLPPHPEQRSIAHVLRTVQRAKEATENVIAAARQLKQSLMRHLFTYGPVPFDQADQVKLKETEIGEIPADWEVVPLGKVVTDTQYGLSKRGQAAGKFPILRMNNLSDGRVSISDLQYVDLDDEEFQKYRLNVGNLLFNRTNSLELVGKTGRFDLSGDFVFASYLIRVAPSSEKLTPEFANYYLNFDQTQARLKHLATRAVSQSNINATKLKGFSIVLPPLEVQQQVGQMLVRIDQKLERETARRAGLDALFKTLLHHLMTGKVRVSAIDMPPVKHGRPSHSPSRLATSV